MSLYVVMINIENFSEKMISMEQDWSCEYGNYGNVGVICVFVLSCDILIKVGVDWWEMEGERFLKEGKGGERGKEKRESILICRECKKKKLKVDRNENTYIS